MAFQIDSKIVLSFAMKGGGHSFSTWLRDRLMKEYHLFDPLAVYLDTVASRHIPLRREWHLKPKFYSRPTPKLDTREATGKIAVPQPIGLMRKDWDTNFQAALASAQVMVVVLEQHYGDSTWCMQEVRQVREESARRVRRGGPPIRIVVLDFQQSDKAGLFNNDTVVVAQKVSALEEGNVTPFAFAADQWKISDAAVADLKRAIGPLF